MLSRQYTLASRPTDRPTAENFALREVELPDPGPGQVLIKNTHLSVDPYMRGLILDGSRAGNRYKIGEPMWGGAVGTVVSSRSSRFAPGDFVTHLGGWRDAALMEEGQVTAIDTSEVSPSAYLGVLGLTGFTAYLGVRLIGEIKAGDVVLVSAAAGAVGSVAGQLARRYGASRVVGSVGSEEKRQYVVKELGFDAAFDYRDGSLTEQVAAVAPDGIDVYFDNVGGEHLEAAIASMREFGRVVLCGAINHSSIWHQAPGPRNLALAIPKRLTLRGYVTNDHEEHRGEFVREMTAALRDGSVVAQETVLHGLDRAPAALTAVLEGGNIGKMIVEV